MPRVGGRKVARLRQLTSSGQQVQPADPEKVDVERDMDLCGQGPGGGAMRVWHSRGAANGRSQQGTQLSLFQTGPYHH
jgi:hypothetical protein